MTRWMWCCVGTSLTLLFASVWYLFEPSRVATGKGRLLTPLPASRCPPHALEADGVCLPLGRSTEPSGARTPSDAPVASDLQALGARILPLSGGARLLALDQAAVPPVWRLPGDAFATRTTPGSPVPCPQFRGSDARLLGGDTEGGWVVVGASRAHTSNPEEAWLLIAGLKAIDAQPLRTTGACPPGTPLGLSRDQIVLSARHPLTAVPSPTASDNPAWAAFSQASLLPFPEFLARWAPTSE